MDEDEAVSHAQKIAKIRTYDRMYAIGDQEKKLKEAEEVKKNMGSATDQRALRWLTPREEKFVNSLPGWVKPLITYVSVQDPGVYADSYRLTIRPLPSGAKSEGEITFYGMQSWAIKDMLKRYREKGEIPDVDYSVYEEY